MKLKFDTSQLNIVVDEISERLRKKDFSFAMKEAQRELIDLMCSCFEEQKSPSGKVWPRHSDYTIEQYNRTNHEINAPLIDTGELYESIKYPSRGEWVVHTYSLAWRPKLGNRKMIHNTGNPNNRMYGNLAPIPDRRFIPNQREFNEVVENVFQKVLKELRK